MKQIEQINVKVQETEYKKYEVPFYTKLKVRRGFTTNETLVLGVLLTRWWITPQGCTLQNKEIWILVGLWEQYISNLIVGLKEKKVVSVAYEGVTWNVRRIRRVHIIEDLRAFTY